MNILNIFRIVTTNSIKCVRAGIPTSIQTRQFPRQLHTKTLEPLKEDVLSNLQETFDCNEYMANEIYRKFPSLQSVGAIKCDSLELLRDKVSSQSIIENPSLVTMDIKILKRKINAVQALKPKKLDDFLPLLNMDEIELRKLVNKLAKERHEIEQKNRIYYLSEILQIEPKVISKRRADCGYELFKYSFQNFKKKLNILVDYGVSPMNILNGLLVIGYRHESIFIRRSEQMLSVGIPIQMSHFRISDTIFNGLILRYSCTNDSGKAAHSELLAKRIKMRNSEKATIVKTLKSLLQCDETEASEFYYNHVNEMSELECAQKNIKYLLKIPISLETIKDNGFLLTMSIDEIEEKLPIVNEMEPKNIKDFIPLMNIDLDQLRDYKCRLEKINAIGCDHPIYYFSEKLNVEAKEVAMSFAEKKSAFLQCTTNSLKYKLDALLKNNVEPSSILNCSRTFLFNVKRINDVASKLKSSGIEKISSWMITMRPESPRYVHLTSIRMREKESLGGFESSTAYLAHRLDCNESEMSNALMKYPFVPKVAASKIKEHLDYFLNETQITAYDIKSNLYIFHRKLDTLKARIEDMTEIKAPITLTVILYTRKAYLHSIWQYCKANFNDEQSKLVFQKIKDREYSK